MQFMMIVKHAEKQGPPPKELIDAITKMSEEAAKAAPYAAAAGWGQLPGAPASAFLVES